MPELTRWMKYIVTVALLILLAGGFYFYRVQEQHQQRLLESELHSIAELKVHQITVWREACLADAAVIMESPLFADGIAQWMADPKPEAEDSIRARLKAVQKYYHYAEILLIDTNRQIQIRLEKDSPSLYEVEKEIFTEAATKRQPMLTDLHVCTSNTVPHLTVVAPIFHGPEQDSKLLGAVLLIVNARDFLFPLIQYWPTPSVSAETLLVRRDGDSVLFLNELRHQSDTALKLRIPLTQEEVPAVMVVQGKRGVVEGLDYRNVPVMSVLEQIPDSPWFMVAKIDTEEALSSWRTQSRFILLILFCMVVILGGGGVAIVMSGQKAYFKNLYLSEAARRLGEERLATTLRSIGDGVIATDAEGCVELLNSVAEELTGWTAEEAHGKSLEEVFHIINEETRAKVENPAQRVLREGIVVGLANHTLLIAKDGKECPIADSGAPIRDDKGAITGVVLVFRDQTEERMAQKRLQQEMERSQQYLDTAGVIMVALDIHANVVLLNQKGCQILGWKEQEILGKNWFETCLPAPMHKDIKAVFSRIVSGQLSMDEYVENTVLTKKGEERLIAWHNAILRDDHGHVIGALSSGEDITDRKQSESMYQAMVEHAPLGMHFYELRPNGDLVFVGANPSADTILGIQNKQLVGKTIEEAFPGLVGTDVPVHYRNAAAQGISWSTEQIAYEHGAVRGAFYVSAFQIAHNKMVAVFMDITKRKKMEAERAQLTSILENTSDMVATATPDQKIMYINIAGRRMLGLSEKEDVTARNISDFHPAWAIEKIRTEGIPAAMEKGIWSGETALMREGKEFPVSQVILAHHSPDGTLEYISTIVRDISERERAKEEREKLQAQLLQAQKMESVGRLAGGVAHDFNNMLGVILGRTESLLEQVGTTPTQRKDLEEIQKAGQRSADLTRQLLAFARKQTVAPKIISLNETVTGLLKMLRRIIGEDIDLAWLPGEDLAPVKMDPVQIDQILVNLLVNARDAITGVGKVTIETANRSFDAAYCAEHTGAIPGHYVMLAVSDDGSGMDKTVQEHLFEPFFTTKGMGHGTGLGLATVYGIVKQNNGFINVYSEKDKGTSLRIYIPRALGPLTQGKTKSSTPLPKGSETVLLVEDDVLTLELGIMMLQKLGYKVFKAATPAEALRLAEQHIGEIQLLITDVVMPGMNGRELASRITMIKPGLKTLFLSGYTANVIAHHGVLDEGVFFLSKPFTREELARAVREALAAP